MPSGEHEEGAAAAKLAEAGRGVEKTTGPQRAIYITPAPVSSPEQAEEHIRAALAAGTRTGASLSALFRAVEQMTDGLSGARESNEQLVTELEAMRQMLAERTEENAALAEQLAALAAERDQALGELEQARSEANREREFFLGEQDRFLAALLEDHEQALAALRRERDEARASAGTGQHDRPTRPGTAAAVEGNAPQAAKELREARQTIEKLMKERNRSREMLRRLQAQRDEAQAALAGASVGDDPPLNVTVHTTAPNPDNITTVPPHPEPSNGQLGREGRTTAPQGPRLAPAIDPQGVRAGRATDPQGAREGRTTDPQGPRARSEAADSERTTDPAPRRAQPPILSPPRGAPKRRTTEPGLSAPTPPPDELRGAIMLPTTPVEEVPLAADGKPALKRKPDPTSRPLGGYSLGADEIEVERVKGSDRGSSKPPQR